MKTKNIAIEKHSILITGASSGIGKATALYLDKLGYKVYAAVRKSYDKDILLEEASPNLSVVMLDVCDQVSISKAFKEISSQIGDHSFSLVNNAGLSLNGPLELLPLDKIKKLLDVNVYGLLSVTKTFLPMIRQTQGRLVNISSGHGLVAIPDKSVYAASKFAVQAISDSLRVELKPFGVKVSNVVVGKINTNVLDKILDERKEIIAYADPETAVKYISLLEFFDREVKNIPAIEATEVAKVITDALIRPNPKAEYLIGPGAKKMKTLARFPRKMRESMLYKAIYK